MLSGLALISAFVGAMISAATLMSAKSRAESEAPALLCLVCSLLYVMAFACSSDLKIKHATTDIPNGVPAKYADRLPTIQLPTGQQYSLGNLLRYARY